MHKINKIQLLKSFFSLIAIFLFNLPTLAALNINYGNLFVIPNTQKINNESNSYLIAQDDSGEPPPEEPPPPPSPVITSITPDKAKEGDPITKNETIRVTLDRY